VHYGSKFHGLILYWKGRCVAALFKINLPAQSIPAWLLWLGCGLSLKGARVSLQCASVQVVEPLRSGALLEGN
jgi:hypothetical protein